jgi:hypothetical protein
VTDPVSWFLIETGWSVLDAEGHEVGKVTQVTGDGLAITSNALRSARYVPSEEVAEIVEGRVTLKLHGPDVEKLEVYTEPAPQERISSEKAPIWLRIGDWFRRR